MGLKLIAVCAAAIALGGASPAQDAARYLEARQAVSGGFAEQGRVADVSTTAWAVLGLKAAGGSPEALRRGEEFLASRVPPLTIATDVALVALALGEPPAVLLDRLRAHRPGKLVNATIWTILALRQAGEPAPAELVQALLAAQTRSGGWSWAAGAAPDSNDTAAALQALRAAGVAGAPVRRGIAFLRSLQARDGGFALAKGRPADAQSTAWAIQAYLAAGRKPPAAAVRFLAALRRPDGGYRYSAAYATTPVWVTAQVLPALAGKAFPLGR